MIKHIQLKNFQQHLDLNIDLQAGVNTIIGATGSGKSNVFQAIDWVLFGGTPGTWMFPITGESPTEVTITFDDGTVISKVRSKTEHHYTFNGEKFAAMRNSVPNIISDYLNIKENVSYQRQDDSYFLLYDSPSAIGNLINEAVDLTVIQDVQKYIKEDKKSTETLLKDANLNVTELSKVVECIDINYLEKVQSELNLKASQLAEIKQRSESVASLHNELQNIRTIDTTKLDQDVTKLNDLKQKIQKLTGEINLCQELVALPTITNVDTLQESVKNLQTNRDKLAQLQQIVQSCVELINIPNIFIDKLDTRYMLYTQQLKKLAELDSKNKLCQEVIQVNTEYTALENELKQHLCPTCGQLLGG